MYGVGAESSLQITSVKNIEVQRRPYVILSTSLFITIVNTSFLYNGAFICHDKFDDNDRNDEVGDKVGW